jgi:hypothetical protein
MDKNCLDCGETIKGRADKKFCSDQCRNNYNNRLNSDTNNYVRNVNNILRKNRRILLGLNKDGKTNVHRDKLVKSGFNFTYFTSTQKTRTGSVYFFCYEEGYLPIEHDIYVLVRRKDSSSQPI